MSVASNDRDAFSYAKLGPFLILGFIAMPRPKQWAGTRVNTHGGTIGPREYTINAVKDSSDRVNRVHGRASKAAGVPLRLQLDPRSAIGAFRPLPRVPAKVPDRTHNGRSAGAAGTGPHAPLRPF
jgi:hypothetical protein